MAEGFVRNKFDNAFPEEFKATADSLSEKITEVDDKEQTTFQLEEMASTLPRVQQVQTCCKAPKSHTVVSTLYLPFLLLRALRSCSHAF